VNNLEWSKAEKQAARRAYDAAYLSGLGEDKMQKIKYLASL
jgi:hypothetical protein